DHVVHTARPRSVAWPVDGGYFLDDLGSRPNPIDRHGKVAMSLTDGLHALDRFQQRRPWLSFLAAVIKKFSDDQASQLAALIAYYAFFSLFPLLLVFVTVLGFVLQGNPSAQNSVLHSTLSQFPIIGNQLQSDVHSLKGSGIALAIGLIGSLLAGLA